MGQSRFPFTSGRDLFGRVENGRGVATKVRADGCAFGAIDQTGTAQKRCEIIDLAMVVEDFIVQRREEFRETHLLFRRDLLERVPKRLGSSLAQLEQFAVLSSER